MLRTQQNNFLYTMLSLLAHAAIIILMLTQLHFPLELPKLGMKQEQILPSYVYQPQPKSEPVIKSVAPKAIPIAKPQPKPAPKPDIKKPQADVAPPAKPQPRLDGNNRPVAELMALLHAAIQEQQQYPANALEMEREGKITLSFIVYKDGTIANLKILKSSGTSSLDNAALAAVQKAAPFKNVSKYVQEPQACQLDVVFELT